MNVRVKCFTGMRRYAPGGQSEFEIVLAEGAQVAQLLAHLNVPADAAAIIAVNGARAEGDRLLRDGDTVVLFTPMEGG
jgi:molybdopterin converting factor small subunit